MYMSPVLIKVVESYPVSINKVCLLGSNIIFYFARTIQRPLGRTQSAPLPLGHPMLQPQAILLPSHQSEQYAREKRLCEQQQHNLLKQVSCVSVKYVLPLS